MSTTSLTSVFRELFVSPLDAVSKTEEDYRRIWADWMESQLEMLRDGADKTKLKDGVDLKSILDTAPVISLDGVIEVGITMRIASVQEFTAEARVGLAVGPIYGSGGFGFVNRSSQESVFQASTRYVISNFARNLQKYLADRNIPVADVKDVRNAIAFLRAPKQGE
jgi:hypothetical protein